MNPGLKLHQGHSAGRDPRQMTRDELSEAGHQAVSPLQAIRARCLDCCAGQVNEVAVCPVVECPAWPFRMGTNPWRLPVSDARREAARRSMTQINARRRERDTTKPLASLPERGTAPSLAMGSGAAPTWATGRDDPIPNTELHREETNGQEQDRDELGSALPLSGT